MRCPKCGAEQQDAATCSKCQVVIANYLKYLERQQTNPRPVIARPPVAEQAGHAPKKLPIGKIAAAVMFLVLVIAGLRYKAYKDSLKGSYDEISGQYANQHFGFSLIVPAAWKRYSVKDAISCKTIQSEYADNYFLLSSPTEPSHSMIVVSIAGLTADYFASHSWESIVAETGNRNKVVSNSIETIDNFRVYRMGYMIGGAYREDNYFIANNEMMLIYFYVVSPEDSPGLLESMRNSMQSLKGI
jgi:hypothetical protein